MKRWFTSELLPKWESGPRKGDPRRLRYDWNATIEFQRRFREFFAYTYYSTGEMRGLDRLQALLWAGLLAESESITPREVSDLIETFADGGGDVVKLQQEIHQAITESGIVERIVDSLTRSNGAHDPPATGEAPKSDASPT